MKEIVCMIKNCKHNYYNHCSLKGQFLRIGMERECLDFEERDRIPESINNKVIEEA